jgi:hypothetical protein
LILPGIMRAGLDFQIIPAARFAAAGGGQSYD